MLKKAVVVLSIMAASSVAVSPLAFAGDYGGDRDHDRGRDHSRDHDRDRDRDRDRGRDNNTQRGLINISDVGVQVPVQACGNRILSGVLGILSSGVRNKDGGDTSCKQSNSNR